MAIIAAGAILWRREKDELKVLLIHRARYDDWSWPKGKLDKGESIAETAVREIKEETGLSVTLGVKLYISEYKLDGGGKKQVHYWSAQVSDEALKNQKFKPDDEVSSFEWLSPKEAKKRLSYEHDEDPLEVLLELDEANRLETKPLIILRHAKATPREDWDKGEGSRPLLPVGGIQALELVRQLSAYGPTLVITSPWKRCKDTVMPFVDKHKVKLLERSALSEMGTKIKPAKAQKLVHKIVTDNRPTIVCSHRPALPTLIEAVSSYGSKHRQAELKEVASLKPGEFYVIHFAQNQKGKVKIVSVEFGE